MFQAARFGTSHDLRSTKRTSSVADPPSMLPMEKFTQPKTTGNLVSLGAPKIKQMLLEESVMNFSRISAAAKRQKRR